MKTHRLFLEVRLRASDDYSVYINVCVCVRVCVWMTCRKEVNGAAMKMRANSEELQM